MANCKASSFIDQQSKPPVGCALTTLSDKCKLHLLLKGIIDIEKEETKLNKKNEKLERQKASIKN